MTQSEKEADEKFDLNYHTKHSISDTPQKDLIWCLNFATEAHKYQKRKDAEKTPYINHPIGVAYILTEEAGITNLDLLRGCLLHDTVEDTLVVSEEIRGKFGVYLGDLVDEVTDDKNLPKQKRKDLQVAHAPKTSPQGKLVKLADKLYNLRDLERALPEGWTEERRNEYFKWALKVCDGLRGVSPQLEEKLDAIFIKKGLITKRERTDAPLSPPWPSHYQLKPLITAANFAAIKHSRHFVFDDSNNVPYINHLVSVAFIVSQEADIQEVSVLCAALLRDVVGKAGTSLVQVKEQNGVEVSSLVEELTYNHSLSIQDQFKIQIARAPRLSYSAKVITLATVMDACHRLEASEPATWSRTDREEYFSLSHQLTKTLSGTHARLEEKLGHILVR